MGDKPNRDAHSHAKAVGQLNEALQMQARVGGELPDPARLFVRAPGNIESHLARAGLLGQKQLRTPFTEGDLIVGKGRSNGRTLVVGKGYKSLTGWVLV